MSKSNQVQTWRFGRTRALFVTQKLLNRAKNMGAERRSEFFSCVQFNFFRVYKTQLEHNNCKIKSFLSGLVTRRLYFLKKYDTKQPKFPPCRNWPIWGLLGGSARIYITGLRRPVGRHNGDDDDDIDHLFVTGVGLFESMSQKNLRIAQALAFVTTFRLS